LWAIQKISIVLRSTTVASNVAFDPKGVRLVTIDSENNSLLIKTNVPCFVPALKIAIKTLKNEIGSNEGSCYPMHKIY
jgi:hypothetical protein